MGFANVALYGGNYYRWKKITVAGERLTLTLPLRTGSFQPACVIAMRLACGFRHHHDSWMMAITGMGIDRHGIALPGTDPA